MQLPATIDTENGDRVTVSVLDPASGPCIDLGITNLGASTGTVFLNPDEAREVNDALGFAVDELAKRGIGAER